MHSDLEGRMDKLVAMFAEVESDLRFIVANEQAQQGSPKRHLRAQAQAGITLNNLAASVGPPTHAAVKLAYVRGVREVVPNMRLNEEHLERVHQLSSHLHVWLIQAMQESQTSVRKAFRQMALKQNAMGEFQERLSITLGTQRLPATLEQRAGALIRNVMQQSADEGRVAGQSAAGYDLEPTNA